MVETHGAQRKSRNSRAHRSQLLDSVLQDVAAIAAPLRGRLAELDAEIAEHLEALSDLREARRVIVNGLKPFEPKAPGGKGATSSDFHAEQDAKKLEVTRAFVLDHPELTRFTRNSLVGAMREAGINPTPSIGKMERYVEVLRDEGIIRAGNVVKGGGLEYIVISEGSQNGSA
jgi:hypothetical protein